MREEGVSVTYQTGMSKRVGVPVHHQPGQRRRPALWHQPHLLLSWLVASRRLRRVWLRGLRHVQFPFLLLRRSFWGLILALNWWDIIDEQVLLGGALMFDDLERLRRQGVEAVVNLCAERSDNPRRLKATQMDYLWLPVVDTRPPTVEQILQGLAWIEERVYAGRKVYIHCAAGIGRSVTLLACWYLYTCGMSVPQVLEFVQRRRPQAALTRRQVRRIEELARLLAHTAGKLPVQETH
jgi:atypical dual specificity phosphatase